MIDVRNAHVHHHTCPSCGYMIDRVGNLTGDCGPSPGDITFCLKCGQDMVFNDDMTIRAATPAEHEEIMKYPAAQEFMRALPKVHGRH